MARRRRRQKDDSSTAERELFNPDRSLTVRLLQPTPSLDLGLYEDRRRYDPLGFFRPARQMEGGRDGPLRVTTPKNKSRAFLAHGLQFPSESTVICVRRKQRKEVLFAKRKTGKGARAHRRRRNRFSEVGC